MTEIISSLSPEQEMSSLTSRQIILSVLFLNPGNGSFRINDLEEGLKKVDLPKPPTREDIESVLLIHSHYLCQGDSSYRLNPFGRGLVQSSFSEYTPETQERLKKIAYQVWQQF